MGIATSIIFTSPDSSLFFTHLCRKSSLLCYLTFLLFYLRHSSIFPFVLNRLCRKSHPGSFASQFHVCFLVLFLLFPFFLTTLPEPQFYFSLCLYLTKYKVAFCITSPLSFMFVFPVLFLFLLLLSFFPSMLFFTLRSLICAAMFRSLSHERSVVQVELQTTQ